MDLFTQSVDASLWSSRAEDDALHDDAPVIAAESVAPVKFTGTSPPSTLVVAHGRAAAAITSAFPSSSAGTFEGAALPLVEIRVSGAVALLQLPDVVPEHRATALADAVWDAVKPERLVVLTATSGKNVCAQNPVQVLSMDPCNVGAPMEEPDFVQGVPAALMTRALFHQMPAACIRLVTELAMASTAEAEMLYHALLDVANGMGVEVGEASLDNIREQLALGNPTPPAMYT